ncbi:MAG: glycosyltransferase family 4 protein [Woeseiaceae bacterium]|nr:glycosyltransferase family 4 protein [Woeseiaceae bacterium]
MRPVAFLLGNLTDGGSETKVVRMANRMVRVGLPVHLIYLGAPHTLRDAIDDDVPVEFLDRGGKFSFRALKRLRKYVSSEAIGTVFCVNHYPLVYGWPVFRAGTGRRCFGAINTYEIPALRDRLFMLLYAFILRRCDRVIFGSRAQQQLWVEKYRLQKDRTTVIYNGVDADHFRGPDDPDMDLRASLDIDEDAIVIGCVAHLRPEKSHQDLLAAMASPGMRSNAVLLLIGDGPEEPALRQYVELHDLSAAIRFVGRVDDVRPYLSLMDIFVLPSSSEVFSNAILEAMAARIPVVCTAVGGSIEMVESGETGFLYPRHDVDELVKALETLIADSACRERFGANAAARVREMFSIERMDEQYVDLMSWSSSERDRD